PRRQIAVNYPRRVQGPERFGDCRDIVDDCSPGRFVQTPERAGRALGNVAPLDMVERKEQTVALLEQRTRTRGANALGERQSQIMLVAQPVPHVPTLLVGHAEAAALLENGDSQFVR